MSSKPAKSDTHSNNTVINNGGVVVNCGRSLSAENRLNDKNTKTPGTVMTGINRAKRDVELTSYNDDYYKPPA